ncbi:MAG: HD domain-containing protein [Solobacterium sp.]|nr:HD domain-containing protein [Solobacterium sp.]
MKNWSKTLNERWNSFVRVLCWEGQTKETYIAIQPMMAEHNLLHMRMFLGLASVVAGVLLLVSMASPRLSHARALYASMCGGSFLMLFLAFTPWAKKRGFRLLFCYLTLAMELAFSLILGIYTGSISDAPAVSFIVMLVGLPLLFTDVLWRMGLFQTGAAFVFLLNSKIVSSPDVFELNTVNAISFLFFSLFLYGVVSCTNANEAAEFIRIREEKEQIAKIQQRIIVSMADLIEERDENTGEHVKRTMELVKNLLYAMKQRKLFSEVLTDEYIEMVIQAAALHDIGKIRIPDAVLLKPGRLDEAEFAKMRMHAPFGGSIVHRLLEGIQDERFVNIAFNVAKHHHERYDGTGYPDGLKGEAIPLEARVMALADVYDALTAERCYKKAMPKEQALRIMKEGRGTQFDPVLCDLFVELRENDEL